MKGLSRTLACLLVSLTFGIGTSSAYASINQTDDLTPILPESGLPFHIVIEKAGFQLPVGFHSGMVGVYKGLWVFIGGSLEGLHGFAADPFPAYDQNTMIYVVNPTTGSVVSRSLADPSSGLNQRQIDSLSVISPQGYQDGDTLYITGGYGVDNTTGAFGTRSTLTAVNLAGIVQWVTNPGNPGNTVVNNIRQLDNPIFQISGGRMYKTGNMTQLMFGQNFTGVYTPGSNGNYSQQIQQFQIKSAGGQLAVDMYTPIPQSPNINFRRRDLNIVPALLNNNNTIKYGYIAYAGVFTLAGGVWTVPVVINDTSATMADPTLPTTFKQAMNQYVCATAGLYSKKSLSMYHIFLGGISYGFYDGNGVFQTDNEIPFINQVTTVAMDNNGTFRQYRMSGQYPTIASTGANAGNPLLFGAGAYFIESNTVQKYPNSVINLDNIRQPTVIGYVVGGIASTLANTNVQADSIASPYIFKVTLVPN
jgi:hypothetical protein